MAQRVCRAVEPGLGQGGSVNSLYREFTLRSPADAGAMVNFIKSNAAAFVDKGTPLRVIVTEEEMDRLDEQIKYYFGVVVKAIARTGLGRRPPVRQGCVARAAGQAVFADERAGHAGR